MSSPLLALFARSLREDVRTRITYFARTGLVLVILLFLFSVSGTSGWGNAPGLEFFSIVIYINLFFIVLAGLSYFASAITEEKEEMTLGLLRMTNLNPLSILLGKSTSRLVGALLLLVAQVPFTLLAISLGGVAVRQIVAAYCTLGAFLVFFANLSLLASVIFRRTTAAATFSGVMLIGLFAVMPLLGFFAALPLRFGMLQSPGSLLVWLDKAANFVALASPIHRLGSILTTGFAEGPAGVQVWTNLALGAGCFLLAWLVFDRFCSEQGESAPSRAATRSRKGRLVIARPGRAWRHPLAWKDFHFITGGKVWMTVKFILYALPIAAVALAPHYRGGQTNFEGLGYFTLILMSLIGCAELAFMAASIFRHERKEKTLSSLAMLPMSMRRLAYEKLLGCLPALLPVMVYLAFGLLCVSGQILETFFDGRPQHNFYGDLFSGAGYLLCQGLLFLHFVAWLSLYLKRGALPVAIAITIVANMLIGLTTAALLRDNATFALTVMSAVVCLVFHVKIGDRLEELAAEE